MSGRPLLSSWLVLPLGGASGGARHPWYCGGGGRLSYLVLLWLPFPFCMYSQFVNNFRKTEREKKPASGAPNVVVAAVVVVEPASGNDVRRPSR